jgi:NAD(P) transhydrogenase subunit alpha
VSQAAEDRGGYARAQTEDQQEQTRRALAAHVKDQDLVITTAQTPGKPAPRLLTEEMVRAMRPGAVIVDLASESGGNCELTRAGETVVAHGVTIMGPLNLAGTVPFHASQMFSRNVEALIKYLVKDGALHIDLDDAVVGPMCVVRGEAIRTA